MARCGVILILYWYVFKLKGGLINGTTFLLAAWSILFYFSFSVLRLRDISREIMRDVQTGNVEVLFSKPISYLSYRMWWQIGSGLYSFVVITLLAVVALIFIIGLPPTMTIGIFIPTLILTFLCGVILSLFLYTIIGLLSFWIEDINPIFWMVDKAVMILGGSYLPIALFPEFIFKMAIYSPFGSSQFVTHTVYKTWQTNWYQLVGIQLFWIILLGLIIYFRFNKAKQKVSVNGG
jgi:ABC-2 type transport system permease protein